MKVNMNNDDAWLIQLFLFTRALEILQAKRVDYSGSSEPFRNLDESAEFWGVEPWRGAGIRLFDKFSRFKNLAANNGDGQVKDEPMLDAARDALNYICIMFSLWLQEHPEQLKGILTEAMKYREVGALIEFPYPTHPTVGAEEKKET